MSKYEKYAIHYDWRRDIKTFKEYKQMLEHIPFEWIKYRCLKEMYARAQPSANLDKLLEEHFDRVSNGLEPESFYERFFLSREECAYILDKYVEQWYLKDPWEDHLDLIIKDAKEKHIKDKWIPERMDEYGTHPGYRGYEDVPPLKDVIGEENAQKVVDFLKERKDFYYHNRNENAFRAQICLGISPNSCAEKVQEYWKKQGVGLNIDLRQHSNNYFWCEEHGYTKKELKEVEEEEKKHESKNIG